MFFILVPTVLTQMRYTTFTFIQFNRLLKFKFRIFFVFYTYIFKNLHVMHLKNTLPKKKRPCFFRRCPYTLNVFR